MLDSTLPVIQRRVKANARRLKLSIAHHQIFLTTPPHISEQKIQAFLKESEHWLHQTWHKMQSSALNHAPLHGEIITLPLLNQRVKVLFEDELITGKQADTKNKHVLAQQKNAVNQAQTHTELIELLVTKADAGKQLKHWVRNQASIHLPKRLNDLAQQHGFRYSNCTVRHAKTRWGSCSAKGSINLNVGLMLMPVSLLDYVVLHELCHTRQLNHSALFWAEMHHVDAKFMQHRHELREFKLPTWWHLS